MKEEELKPFIVHTLKMFLKTVKPWKKNVLEHENPDYANGWNECIKEMKKNGDAYIKKIESL